MTTIEAHIPDQLAQQARALVARGWAGNLDDLIAESLRRYLESHQEALTEGFIREDVEWGLKDGN
jgi:Arc/MetJ-type ribon-helix-helix transcriptional regulator